METNKKQKHGFLRVFLIICILVLMGVLVFLLRLRTLRESPLTAFETPPPVALSTPTPHGKFVRSIVQTPEPSVNPAPATPAPEHVLGANTINIVLMGLDSDDEREAKNAGWRSDTIAVLSVDVKKHTCTVINVPRDTRARIRKLSSTGKQLGTQYNRINSAFHYGGGPEKKGHENLLYSLERLLFDGLDSEVSLGFYASIDMECINLLADAVGGVEVTLAHNVPGFGKKGETITLTGKNTEQYVRMRHGVTGGSDIGRIGRQQEFIRAFAKKVKTLGAREVILPLLEAVSDRVHTNLNLEQMLVLGDILNNMDLDEIEFITLPGGAKTIGGRSYYVPSTRKVRELAKKVWG